MNTGDLRIAVLGLGEAGSMVASGLGRRARVTGFDPALVPQTDDFAVAGSAEEAVADASLILALTAGPDAVSALESVLGHTAPGAVYADFSSSSPQLKAELARLAEGNGLVFADAVLMAPVLRSRLATPVLVSGSGAVRFAEMLTPLGMLIESLGGRAGDAAARKLLRSIVVKGLTALLVESLRTAELHDQLDWFSDHVTETLGELSPELIRRLLDGTVLHSTRRVHEMQSALDMVEAAGLTASMTRGTVETLSSIDQAGIPRGGVLQ